MPKSVFDAHRLIGPVPFDDLPQDPRPEMDRLGIERACVTHTLSLYSDARAGNDALLALGDPRLVPVPVVVPGDPGPGSREAARDLRPAAQESAARDALAVAPEPVPRDALAAAQEAVAAEVAAWGVRMIRLCPERHRFDLTGPAALRLLAAVALPVAIDLDETSPAQLRHLAERLPDLRILVLNTGYRRLRALAELMAVAPNVWAEIGTVNTQGGVEWLAERFGAGRLVFGTGAPVSDDCGPRFLLDHLDLPPEDVGRIAAGSLEALL
ncbi:amidohydrolase family protein [Nonomuraea zeae]|uniref:Amidohydrolase-related domain-containing protein n=1 Tax=Nonomuraea zeae TaxID=1642303 RepID=A0A5S4GLZ7_9ACTN|nr:amidohydrolase family protein [Nonomuraea zeae]TMR33812.1 hypothetical protein ETD85_18905 [Nonomuraea zeae]